MKSEHREKSRRLSINNAWQLVLSSTCSACAEHTCGQYFRNDGRIYQHRKMSPVLQEFITQRKGKLIFNFTKEKRREWQKRLNDHNIGATYSTPEPLYVGSENWMSLERPVEEVDVNMEFVVWGNSNENSSREGECWGTE